MSIVGQVEAIERDCYRFGAAPMPSLQPGTLGWSASDLRDPEIRALWDAGRYEILNGILTLMPPALFEGGQVVDNLKYILRDYFLARGIRYVSSGEVDIEIDPARVVRADSVVIVGGAIAAFEALQFPPPDSDWKRNPLTLPPTLIIESVSRGHKTHDHVTKKQWYAEFRVPNYWIVDALSKSLECWILRGGEFFEDASGKGNDRLRPSGFDGLEIDLHKVWEG